MSSPKPSRSSSHQPRRWRLLAFGLVAVLTVSAPLVGALVTTDIYVVAGGESVAEDQYVTATRGIVEGTLDGDLTIFTGDLTISGEVTGDVQVFSIGTVRITESGHVGGSVRGTAVNVVVEGRVATDVFMAAASVVVEEPGAVGRDLMTFGGVTRAEGEVRRDIRGRTYRNVISGSVSGDIDVATQDLVVGSSATVDGDVLYRSPREADIDPSATIAGTVTRLPAQSNFIYGIILSLANLVGFLAFIVTGLVALMLLRGTGSRAAGAIVMNPLRSALYGLGAVIVGPVVVVVLAATLVGLPLAIFIGMLLVALLVVGPVPAVTAMGNRIMFGRGGLLGAFVFGAILWRLGIWLIPVVGGFLYLIALVWGTGGWIAGAIATRRKDPLPLTLLPSSMLPQATTAPPDWVPPLAPSSPAVDHAAATEEITLPIEPVDDEPDPGEPEDDPSLPVDDETEAPPTGDHVDDDDPDDPPETDTWGLPSGLRP